MTVLVQAGPAQQRWRDPRSSIAVGDALAHDRPFGSHDYLAGHVDAVHMDLLRMLAGANLPARRLLHSLSRSDDVPRRKMLRDSLLRRTVEDGVCLVAQGLDSIPPSLLDDLLEFARGRDVGAGETMLAGGGSCRIVRSGDLPVHLWLGNEPRSIAETRFVGEILKRLPGLQLVAADASQVGQVAEAIDLVLKVVPSLADSALRHVFMVVLGAFSDPKLFNSMTIPGMPGVIFINPLAVTTTLSLAHALLHEAMHLKFMDIEYVHPLFVEGFRPTESPVVTPVWHEGRVDVGHWPVDRVLTSMHVYVSLAVFADQARDAVLIERYGEADLHRESRRCVSRARWLHDAALAHEHLLSPSGRAFVSFNGTLIDQMSDSEDDILADIR